MTNGRKDDKWKYTLGSVIGHESSNAFIVNQPVASTSPMAARQQPSRTAAIAMHLAAPSPTTDPIIAAAWPRRVVPAWMLSLAMHLAAMLLGSLLVGGKSLPTVGLEPVRRATIVLARRTSADHSAYFSEDAASNAAPASSSPAAGETADSLPAVGEPPPMSNNIALPELPGSLASGRDLVVVPQLSPGSGRPRLFPGLDDAAIRAADAKNRRPGRITGPTAQLSLFGSGEATGWSFVFLIDRSQSMGGEGLGAIAAAAQELARKVERLTEQQMFQVIAYNQKPLYLTKRELIPATAKNKQQMLEFVKNLPAFGATEHESGLLAALRLEPDVIFLFTDGGDPVLRSNQLRTIREAAAGQTSIHVLHFGAGPASSENAFLPRLAGENRGSYVYIDMNRR